MKLLISLLALLPCLVHAEVYNSPRFVPQRCAPDLVKNAPNRNYQVDRICLGTLTNLNQPAVEVIYHKNSQPFVSVLMATQPRVARNPANPAVTITRYILQDSEGKTSPATYIQNSELHLEGISGRTPHNIYFSSGDFTEVLQ
jgi:hypothetical protein